MFRPAVALLMLVAFASCSPEERSADAGDSPDAEETEVEVDCEDLDLEKHVCDFKLDEVPVGDPLSFTTSGCWTVTVNHDAVKLTDPFGRNKVVSSGNAHEYLNGKHIKDWLFSRRTVIFPGASGDVVVTMHADGPQGLVRRVSLYDEGRSRVIDNESNSVTYESDDATITAGYEAEEADGETSRITPLKCERVSWANEYLQEEDDDGVPLAKEPDEAMLGTTGGSEKPNQVHDFYDDPRHAHT